MFNRIKDYFMHKEKDIRDNRLIFTGMLIGSIISLYAAFVLSVHAIELAQNPQTVLTCSINAVIDCATVAKSSYSSLFGFPNSFLGMISEPIVITVAIAGLVGIRFPKGFMFAAQIGYSLGFILAYYLFFVSTFLIGAICPWCFLVTLATTFVWFSITRFNIKNDNLYLPAKVQAAAKRFIEKDFDRLALAIMLVGIFVILYAKYGNALFA